MKLFEFEHCKQNNFRDFLAYYDLNLRNSLCLKNHSMKMGGYSDEIKASVFSLK